MLIAEVALVQLRIVLRSASQDLNPTPETPILKLARWILCPASPQVLAVDIMYCHPAISEVSLRTCALLCLTAAYPPQLGVRAVELLSRRAAAGAGEGCADWTLEP